MTETPQPLAPELWAPLLEQVAMLRREHAALRADLADDACAEVHTVDGRASPRPAVLGAKLLL
jgi:hypothetical protein